MKCKNCDQALQGNYCSACGQSSAVGPINFATFSRELSESVFQVNRGLFFSIKELSVRPGHGLADYLAGKRKPFIKPITFVLSLSTLYFLVTQWTTQNTWLDDIISGWLSGAKGDSAMQAPPVLVRLKTNFAYVNLFLLPLFSLGSYLAFKPFRKNYLEHLVVNAYIAGQQALIYTLFTLLSLLGPAAIFESAPFFLAMAYTFWVFWQLFPLGLRALNILRSFLCYIIYYILVLALALSLVAISGLS